MIDKITELLKQRFPDGIQTFFSPSISYDPKMVIFSENGVEIRHSYRYDYIEVLGLNDDEEEELIYKLGEFY